jgi:hypothetical protein
MEYPHTTKEIVILICFIGQVICYILILFQILAFKKDLDKINNGDYLPKIGDKKDDK